MDKWHYCCNQNLSYQKRFALNKTLKQDRHLLLNFYMMGRSFNMYTILACILRSYFRVERLTFSEWRATLIDHLLKVLVCFFWYFEPNQLIILWKVPKRKKKD